MTTIDLQTAADTQSTAQQTTTIDIHANDKVVQNIENRRSKYRGACCAGAYEYEWLKQETCCFCLGVRCALLTMCLIQLLAALEQGAIGVYFMIGNHRSFVGAFIDITFAIGSLFIGSIGYYAVYTSNEKAIRIFWFLTLAMIPTAFCVFVFAITEFALLGNMLLMMIMIADMMFAVPFLMYVAYKVKRYYDLVFSHYHQLSDGPEAKN